MLKWRDLLIIDILVAWQVDLGYLDLLRHLRYIKFITLFFKSLKKLVVKLKTLYSQSEFSRFDYLRLFDVYSLQTMDVFNCIIDNGNVERSFQDGCWHLTREPTATCSIPGVMAPLG